MAYSGRELSRTTSTGQMGTSLDGVRFCLSDKFKPPPKVTLPINFEIGNPTEVLFMEYDFSLEDQVVEWIQKQREAEKALNQVETQRVASAVEQFMQQQQTGTLDEESGCGGSPVNGRSPTPGAIPAQSQAQCDPAQHPNAKPNTAPTNPFYAAMGSNGILVPTPIMSAKVVSSHTVQPAKFNVADFEREADPFDKLELATINDMEELNKVLTGAQSSHQDVKPNEPANVSHHFSPSANKGGDPSNAASTSIPPPVPPRRNVHSYENTQSLKNVEYPDIFNRDSMAMTTPSSVASSQHVSNPFRMNNGMQPPSTESSLPPLPSSQFLVQQQQQPHPPATSTANLSRLVVDLNSKSVGYSCSETRDGQMKSARSTPDIGQLSGEVSRSATTYTPPPRQMTFTPPPHPANQQSWTYLSPESPPQVGSNSAPSSRSTTPITDRIRSPTQLPNPYSSLSQAQKQFVDTLTVMGFPQARTARSVARLGLEDKEVVDFLCRVNRLSDSGYSPDDSEIALTSFKMNDDKAKQYLQLLGQFQELGFDKQKIQEALISTELDEDKALDILTAL